MTQTTQAARFVTEWDTAPNPTYDIWTSVNGSEIIPGVLCPLVASTFNRYDYLGLRRLMATYPGGHNATLVPPPAGNFFGIFGGRLALNNGFSVAAVSRSTPRSPRRSCSSSSPVPPAATDSSSTAPTKNVRPRRRRRRSSAAPRRPCSPVGAPPCTRSARPGGQLVTSTSISSQRGNGGTSFTRTTSRTTSITITWCPSRRPIIRSVSGACSKREAVTPTPWSRCAPGSVRSRVRVPPCVCTSWR